MKRRPFKIEPRIDPNIHNVQWPIWRDKSPADIDRNMLAAATKRSVAELAKKLSERFEIEAEVR